MIQPAGTLRRAPGVSVTMASAPDLTLDSNRPCTGPQATYVAFRVTNTSGTRQTDLRATISGFSGGITLAGGQPASQYIGSLAAGASRNVYWFVTYPCAFDISATLTVSVTDASAGAVTGSGTVTTKSMISAQAGGVLVSGTLGPGAVVGQTIHLDVTYDFGGADVGTTYDLQPVGNTSFNAGCFQMVGSLVTTSNILAIPSGTADQQYFTASERQTGNGQQATIRYYFKYLCAGVTSTARPYSNQLSGTQLKYSSNYESFVGPTLPGATIGFTVAKSVSPTTLNAADTVTYTVTVQNVSAFTAELDSIVDVLPAGVTYTGIAAGSGVTAANSGSVPASPATGTIRWRGPYTVPAGASLTLLYRASVPRTAGTYTNSATAYSGLTAVGTASAPVTVLAADVETTKSGPASAVLGDTLRFVVTTTNHGPGAAVTVVRTDTLPASVQFVSATGGATLSGQVVTWPAISSLASGATRTDTVVVVASTLGSQVNVAASASLTDDPTPGNNDGSAAGGRVTTSVVAVSYGVDVTPKGLGGAAPTRRIAGTAYSQLFTIANQSNVTELFDLLARGSGAAGSFLAVDSVTGPGITVRSRPDSVRVSLTAGASAGYTVWYTVPFGAVADDSLFLRARSVAQAAVQSGGWAETRRVRPSVTLAKTVNPSASSPPGTDLTYTLQFGNAGEYDARGVTLVDALPPQVAFKLGSLQQSLPSGVTVTVAYSADGGATWSHTPGSGGCGAPAGYDACVQRIRWTLQGDLAPNLATPGTVGFAARIR
ncbi:MAG TPA: DUF11 domain-containing protein [Longimicrobiaceae bacterium]|nr:DUF11 domain-containing protein [Longimicrobiaceae bacterium]